LTLLLPAIGNWLHFTTTIQTLVFLCFRSLTVPLPGAASGVLKNISFRLPASALRYDFISVASAVVKLFIAHIHAKMIPMRPRHWHHTTRMCCLGESRYVLTLRIVGAKRVVHYLCAALLYLRVRHKVGDWSL